jgi:hypothetical protein
MIFVNLIDFGPGDSFFQNWFPPLPIVWLAAVPHARYLVLLFQKLQKVGTGLCSANRRLASSSG